MPRRRSLALGLLLTVIPLAGCGSENPELIPQSRASALSSTADQIASACDANDTVKAKAAITAANQQVSELPRKVNPKLRKNLQDWLAHISDRVDQDCKKKSQPQPSPTATASPSPTETPSPTDTPTPSPTDTPTPSPTDTATPSPTPTLSPESNGGVSAPDAPTP